MRRHSRLLVTLVARLAMLALVGAALTRPALVHAEACGGVQLPPKLESFGQTLVLNGAGIRKATFLNVHVYVGGLYIPAPTHDVSAILKPELSKVLVLTFVRDVDHDEMMDALEEAIHKNAGANASAADAELKSFAKLLPVLKKGTQLVIAYAKDHGVEIRSGGHVRGSVTDQAFAQLLFRAWLGPKPPDSDLKAGLLGAKCD